MSERSTSQTPFSRFRTEVENEIIRQRSYSVPSMHLRREANKDMLNPKARVSAVYILKTGPLPVATLYNILELVFRRDPSQIMELIWAFNSTEPKSKCILYLTSYDIASNKVRQANGMMTLAGHRMKIENRPIFLIEEFKND